MQFQVLLRELRDKPLLVLQVRGFDSPIDTDFMVAASNGATRLSELRDQTKRFVQSLLHVGVRVRFVNGSPETAGYEASGSHHLLSLSQLDNKEFATIWVAPPIRLRYGQRLDNSYQQTQFETAGIGTVETDLVTFVQDHRRLDRLTTVPSDVRNQIELYLQTRDVVILRRLQTEWGQYNWTRLIDTRSRQALLVTSGNCRLPLIVNLGEINGHISRVACDSSDERQVDACVNSGATWIELE